MPEALTGIAIERVDLAVRMLAGHSELEVTQRHAQAIGKLGK